LEYRGRFSGRVQPDLERLAGISAWLRKEREFSYYGDIDFIPTEEYVDPEALQAAEDARFVVSAAESVIPRP